MATRKILIASALAASTALAPLAPLAPLALCGAIITKAYAQAPAYLSIEQLDQLLAPIALYPDALLGQILTAATYPLEVVEANRWVKAADAQGLPPSDRETALAQASWDDSVKALAAMPELLEMLDRDLTWTRQLGDAFLTQQAQVMDSIQRLRGYAQTAGNLRTSEQIVVRTVDQSIYIEPARPDYYYVPYYDPLVIYGSWRWRAYPPFILGPPSHIRINGPGFSFGRPLPIPRPFWRGHEWNWREHELRVDRPRFERPGFARPGFERPRPDQIWIHNPDHRRDQDYRPEYRRPDYRRPDQPREPWPESGRPRLNDSRPERRPEVPTRNPSPLPTIPVPNDHGDIGRNRMPPGTGINSSPDLPRNVDSPRFQPEPESRRNQDTPHVRDMPRPVLDMPRRELPPTEARRPDMSRPEFTRPDSPRADSPRPEFVRPEVARPESARPISGPEPQRPFRERPRNPSEPQP